MPRTPNCATIEGSGSCAGDLSHHLKRQAHGIGPHRGRSDRAIGVSDAGVRCWKDGGRRILVDRVWPRGIAKHDLQIDAWLKDLAPSTELRRWFGHDPAKWDGFRKRYPRELEQRFEALEELVEKARVGHMTLVFSAKDTAHNNAVALKQHLERRLKS